MSIIATISHSNATGGPSVVRATYQRPIEVEAPKAAERSDSVEFSAEAAAASASVNRPSIPYGRLGEQGFDAQKVNQIRASLRDGSYLTPEKLSAAADKLQADLDLLP